MSQPIRNVNSKNFFSDENMLALSEPATYSDWAPGDNEQGIKVRPRPAGDNSTLPYADGVEIINTKGN